MVKRETQKSKGANILGRREYIFAYLAERISVARVETRKSQAERSASTRS
jgi:hypothetical protein